MIFRVGQRDQCTWDVSWDGSRYQEKRKAKKPRPTGECFLRFPKVK